MKNPQLRSFSNDKRQCFSPKIRKDAGHPILTILFNTEPKALLIAKRKKKKKEKEMKDI